MSDWNNLDFLIFLIFFLNTIQGMSRGGSREIISMMCLSVALIFTIKFTIPLASWLNKSPLIQDVMSSTMIGRFMDEIGAGAVTLNLVTELNFCLALLVCFVAIYYLCEGVLNYTGTVAMASFKWVAASRKLGATLGAVRGYVFSIILILITIHIFTKNQVNDVINKSLITSHFVTLFTEAAQKLDSLIAAQDPTRYRELYKYKDLYNAKDIFNDVNNHPQ